MTTTNANATDKTTVVRPKSGIVSSAAYIPFPAKTLPTAMRVFVEAVADAVGCDPAYPALPLMSAVGAAIGTGARLRIKTGWREYPVLWTCVVAESGSGKTPAAEAVLEPTEVAERESAREYEEAMRVYQRAMLSYDADLAAWKRAKRDTRGEPPEEPAAPVCRRFVVSDITIEALVVKLVENRRGLLARWDELAGWMDFARYRANGGSDLPAWLSIHSAGAIRVDRKTGPIKSIYVPSAFVAITGGIQPQTLRRAVTPEYFSCGLAARLLLAMPPRQPRRWRDEVVPEGIRRQMADVFRALWDLPMIVDVKGEPCPRDIPLSSDAQKAFIDFVNEHGREQYNSTAGDLAAVWSKLEATAARFAIIHHLVRVASAEDIDPDAVGLESVGAAVELVRWFGSEARRIYAMLAESAEDQTRRELVEYIQRRGGEITTRDLLRAGRYRTAQEAEAALADLARRHLGAWHPRPAGERGGRPTSVFRLTTVPTTDETPRTLAKDEVLSDVSHSPSENGNGHHDNGVECAGDVMLCEVADSDDEIPAEV